MLQGETKKWKFKIYMNDYNDINCARISLQMKKRLNFV